MELDGRRVVILGGSGDQGSLIAAELDRRGARVLFAGRDAERLQAKASAIGSHVPSVLFDLAVPSHAKHVVDTAIAMLGGIDGAMYSAAKAALSAATLALGRELRRQNVLAVDVRPPHTETGLATRPIAGTAPHMPEGLSPASVATAIVEAIESGQKELAAVSFRPQ